MLGLGNLLTSSSSIQTAVQKQAAAFRTRVIADSGNFESKACLVSQLTFFKQYKMSLLDDVSIVVTPNAYKAGTLYSVLPTAIAGSEIVTNGDFSNGTTGWSSPDYNSTLSIVGGQMKIVNTITLGRVVQAITTVVGKTYLASGTITNIDNSTGIQLKLSNGANLDGAFFDSAFNTTTNPVTITRAFEATATTTYIGSSQGSVVGQSALLDNVSVKEWSGADMDVTRATAATRVDEDGLVNYAEIIGSELVDCGGFECATPLTYWTEAGLASIGGGVASFVNDGTGVNSYIQQDILTAGKTYKVSFDVTRYVEGRLQIVMGSTAYTTDITDGVGTYTFYLEAISTGIFRLKRQGGYNFDFDIDNVSVKEVTRDNVPRIDYTGGGCPHILAEPQRTNLVPESEDFDSYRVAGSTATPNSTTAPDGTNSGILVTQGTNTLVLRVSNVVAPSTTYTFSGYFKSSSSITQVILDITDNGNTTFDLTNEWQRFSVTAESRAGGSPYHFVDVATNGSEGDTFYAWGLQVEEGSYATSYIPTSGSTVTRNQDIFTRDGIGSLINSTEGVLFAEIAALSDNDGTYRSISISDSSRDNEIEIDFTNDEKIRVLVKSGGGTIFSTSFIIDTTLFNKVAVKYKLNDFAVFINGTEEYTLTSGAIPIGLNRLAFDRGDGGTPFYAKVKQLQVYNTALTDDELELLTGATSYGSFGELAVADGYTII